MNSCLLILIGALVLLVHWCIFLYQTSFSANGKLLFDWTVLFGWTNRVESNNYYFPKPNFTETLLDENSRVLARYNKDCPRFLLTDIGHQGLGDQLDHYFYGLYWSTKLKIDLLARLSRGNNSHESKPGGHVQILKTILGIKGLSYDWSIDTLQRQIPLRFIHYNYQQLENIKSITSIPCGTIITAQIDGCGKTGDKWCWLNYQTHYSKIIWQLRSHHSKENCIALNLGFSIPETHTRILNIIIHLRNGDICLHCSLDYFRKILKIVEEVLPATQKKALFIDAAFEMPDEIRQFLWDNDVNTFIGSSLSDTVCRFLTADILISTGSSFPVTVSMFGLPWTPIVIEEEDKFGNNRYHYSADSALLMKNGERVSSYDDLFNIVQSVGVY